MVAQLPRPRPAEAPQPLFVRLLPTPETEAPRNQRAQRSGRRGENQPAVISKSPLARRVPAVPVERRPVDAPGVRERFPFPRADAAYSEFGEELQQETLTQAQRRVPRGSTLARSAQPIEPIVPRYPAEMLNRGIKGSVLLEAFIGAGGAVDDVVVIDDEGKPELAAAAVRAVREASFTPAAGPRGPTPSRITLRFQFTFE